MYELGVSYFERPIISNTPYKYKVLNVGSPHHIYLQLDDHINAAFEAKLENLLTEFKLGTMKQSDYDQSDYYGGMPVIVKDKRFFRGELIKSKNNKKVDVFLVDRGTVMEDLNWENDLFPTTTDIMRIPKLGVSCTLAMICPVGNATWPTDRKWEKDFTGNQSQIVHFLDYFPNSKSFEVSIEVDKVDIVIKYYYDCIAQQVPLDNDEEQSSGQFPVGDYAKWIGLKVPVYGLDVFRDGNKIKCSLQIQPDNVNEVQDKITSCERVQLCNKEVGSVCLAKYGEEYFRSTIIKKDGNNYLVQFVDYKQEQLVGDDDIIRLPDFLMDIQEGAAICYLTDVICVNYQDLDNLNRIIRNRDLYAVVDAYETTILGKKELFVSLYVPSPEFDGTDVSLFDVLKLPESCRPSPYKVIMQKMELVPNSWAEMFMQPPTLISNQVYQFKVFSPGEKSDQGQSLVLQTDMVQRNDEINLFYENEGCSPEMKKKIMQQCNFTGMWIAAKVDDKFRQDLSGWLRGHVLKEEDGKIMISFIDYGFKAWVHPSDVFPLHKYFCKDPINVIHIPIK